MKVRALAMTIFDLIDLRSFSNIWYWIFLGVVWSHILTQPMGIPVDLLRAARAGEDGALDRLAAVSEPMLLRHLAAAEGLGALTTGLWAFVLTSLLILSLGYGVEFAQALLLLAAPLAVARGQMTRTARRLARDQVPIEALPAVLTSLRRRLQAVALGAVFVSAVWGMYHNLLQMMI